MSRKSRTASYLALGRIWHDTGSSELFLATQTVDEPRRGRGPRAFFQWAFCALWRQHAASYWLSGCQSSRHTVNSSQPFKYSVCTLHTSLKNIGHTAQGQCTPPSPDPTPVVNTAVTIVWLS